MLQFQLKPIVKGALTFLPGMASLLPESGGHTASASYCYGVWLKHLVMLWHNGMAGIPPCMAELGPGASLGTGIAALLSGVNRYVALDVVKHSDVTANLKAFDELTAMFQHRQPRPLKGWPDFDHYLDDRLFPSHILSDEHLRRTMAPDRLTCIRRAIEEPGRRFGDLCIEYKVPWSDATVVEANSVDLIVSHAVLGQVEDLEGTYRALTAWLKPGGIMSHQIGFVFQGFSKHWNGYWACPELLWKVIRGKRPYSLNRLPSSTHVRLLRKQGVDLVVKLACCEDEHDSIPRTALARRWRGLSDEDLYCSGLFIQARK